MGTASFTREQLNDVIEQFVNKIMESLGANAADKETSEPELTGTNFKAIDTDGEECIMDALEIDSGTLIADGPFEIFCCSTGFSNKPWIRYNGRQLSNEEFAAEMREAPDTPRIIHKG
jgi:hypothetical protein